MRVYWWFRNIVACGFTVEGGRLVSTNTHPYLLEQRLFSSAPVFWWEHLADNRQQNFQHMPDVYVWSYVTWSFHVIPMCPFLPGFWTRLMASDNSPRGRVSESWPWSCSGRRWWISQSSLRLVMWRCSFWSCQAKVSVWTWRNLRVRTLRRNISAFPNLNVPCNSGIVLAWTNQLTVLDFAIGLKGGEGLPMHSRHQQTTTSFTHLCFSPATTHHNTSSQLNCLTRELTLTTLCRKHQRASLDSWPRPSPGFLGPWRKSDGVTVMIVVIVVMWLAGNHLLPFRISPCEEHVLQSAVFASGFAVWSFILKIYCTHGNS